LCNINAASFLKIESPAPYSLRNSSELKYGMNFAYGGTGVFDTLTDGPNMTTQIDTFEKLMEQNVYTKTDIESSIALVSAAGNDYIKYLLINGRDTKVSAIYMYFSKKISLFFINVIFFTKNNISSLLTIF
jgi:hypothetical protein